MTEAKPSSYLRTIKHFDQIIGSIEPYKDQFKDYDEQREAIEFALTENEKLKSVTGPVTFVLDKEKMSLRCGDLFYDLRSLPTMHHAAAILELAQIYCPSYLSYDDIFDVEEKLMESDH